MKFVGRDGRVELPTPRTPKLSRLAGVRARWRNPERSGAESKDLLVSEENWSTLADDFRTFLLNSEIFELTVSAA